MTAAPSSVPALWSELLRTPALVLVVDVTGHVLDASGAARSRWPALREGIALSAVAVADDEPSLDASFARARVDEGGARVRLGGLELACFAAERAFLLLAAETSSTEPEALSRRERDRSVGEKMQAVAQLAGGVAHDLNNALAVILPNAEALAEQLASGSDLRSQAAEIVEVAKSASHVVMQLMALGLRQPANARPVDVGTLVRDNVGLLQRVVGGAVKLHLQVEEAAGAAHVDPSHLQQVLVNLVVNAADAMPSGGTVRVVVCGRQVGPAFADVLGVHAGSYMAIEIADEGHGISSSVLPRIFEPFFTTRSGGAHAGLGLAAVLGLVRQARGCVTVDNTAAGGAVFTVLVPRIATAQTDANALPERPRKVVGSPRILLVDDEPNVRSALGRLLQRHGFDVVPAEGGLEAIDVVRREAGLRAVLSDVVMPDMDGISLTRTLAAMRPELPVVLMSGYTSEGPAALEELAVPFLQKPFSGADVVRALLDVMDAANARASLALGSGAPPSLAQPESGAVDVRRLAVDVTDSASRKETRRS